ncbi:MAG: ATP-binding protein [Promethearchaeota archaeon]
MEKERNLWLGTQNNSEKTKFSVPMDLFLKHFGIFGSTGSGKTVLSKIIIEELVQNEVPAIIIDPQGDLSSIIIENDHDALMEKGISIDRVERFYKTADFRIFTPGSNKGTILSINPIVFPSFDIEADEAIRLLDSISMTLVEILIKLIKYPSSKQVQSKSVIYTILYQSWSNRVKIENIMDLVKILNEDKVHFKNFMNESEKKRLVYSLNNLMIGTSGLLFSSENTVDIDFLIKKKNGKVPINIIFLKTLLKDQEKQLFTSILIQTLYSWMLRQKSPKNGELRCLFYIDEVAPFLPAGMRSPPSKENLLLILRQARKYGVVCGLATQSPKDIDYHGFDQINNLFFGRIITAQSKDVVKDLLKGKIEMDLLNGLMDGISTLKSGCFWAFLPDYTENSTLFPFKTRYLFSKHLTLSEEDLRSLTRKKEVVKEQDVIENTMSNGRSLEQGDGLSKGVIYYKTKNSADDGDLALNLYNFEVLPNQIIKDVILRTYLYTYDKKVAGDLQEDYFLKSSLKSYEIVKITKLYLEKLSFSRALSEITENGLFVDVYNNKDFSLSLILMDVRNSSYCGIISRFSGISSKKIINKIISGFIKLIDAVKII